MAAGDRIKDRSDLGFTASEDFLAYEHVCNENNHSARKAGILFPEIYKNIVSDDSTLFIEWKDKWMPLLIDIQYGIGLGYDERRSREFAQPSEQVSVLALPIGELDSNLQQAAIDVIAHSGSRTIFFSDNEGRDSTILYDGLRSHSVNFEERPLKDERSRPEYQQANLSLFAFDAFPNDTDLDSRDPLNLSDIQEYFNREMLPSIEDPANATVLRPGNSLTVEEQDTLWVLYLDRFQFLGAQHPISMEDTAADFLDLVTNPNTMISAKYRNGKPVCFTYIMEDFSDLYWLNLPYLNSAQTTAARSSRALFFPGIVASKESLGQNADEVIQLFAKAFAGAGMNGRIYFENTNLSEQYIPRIIHGALNTAFDKERYTFTQATKLDQTDYRLVELLPTPA